MPKCRYGVQNQVSFRDLHEYYFALGFLANAKNAEIRWEKNEEQGAWGSEGRIHCLVPEDKFPQFFKFTAGRGTVYARINCNDYVGTLVTEHNFNYNSKGQNVDAILETVPDSYRRDFQDGYGGKLDINPLYKQKSAERKKPSVCPKAQHAPQEVEKQEPKPKLVPIPIAVGETVIHKTFGKGTVSSVDGNYITVKFPTEEQKKFSNPSSFDKGFLIQEKHKKKNGLTI